MAPGDDSGVRARVDILRVHPPPVHADTAYEYTVSASSPVSVKFICAESLAVKLHGIVSLRCKM